MITVLEPGGPGVRRVAIPSDDNQTRYNRLAFAACEQIRAGTFVGIAHVAPEVFHLIQTELVANRDPTFRLDKTKDGFRLLVGVAGRSLAIYADPRLVPEQMELEAK